MNLRSLKDTAGGVLIAAILGMVLIALVSGGGAVILLLSIGVIGGLALQVLLLAIVADATVQTLKKQKEQ